MARIYHTINIGARANDRTGDSTRVAMKKINTNFAMLFEGTGGEFVNRASSFNAVAFTTYLVDTTGQPVTATLPSSPTCGDTIRFVDSAGNFMNNALTIISNEKIKGVNANEVRSIAFDAVTVTYINSVVGWIVK